MKKKFLAAFVSLLALSGISFGLASCESNPSGDVEEHVHNMIHVEAVEPTCAEGNIEYWYCQDCRKYFSDEAATQEITYAETKLDPVTDEHTYGEDDICIYCGAHAPTEGVAYTYDETYGGYVVSGNGEANDSDIYIAEKYDDGTNGEYPVTAIAESAFRETVITSITLPDTITFIGNRAFSRCAYLTSINLPEGLTTIEDFTFYRCYELTDVVLPESLVTIGDTSFAECGSITSLNIPDSVTSIVQYAFYKCTGLQSVTIGSGLTSMGAQAFSGCSALESINIPEGVTELGYMNFYNCTSLTSIVLPNSLTALPDLLFDTCTALADITLGNRLTTIGTGAFHACPIETFTIPASVMIIGDYAFTDCTSLTSITFEDYEGWYVSTDEGATSGTELNLSDPERNVEYIVIEYTHCYWFSSAMAAPDLDE